MSRISPDRSPPCSPTGADTLNLPKRAIEGGKPAGSEPDLMQVQYQPGTSITKLKGGVDIVEENGKFYLLVRIPQAEGGAGFFRGVKTYSFNKIDQVRGESFDPQKHSALGLDKVKPIEKDGWVQNVVITKKGDEVTDVIYFESKGDRVQRIVAYRDSGKPVHGKVLFEWKPE